MSLILIAVLALAVWAWIDILRARETALRACHRAAQRADVQLLDETVALRRQRPARDADGRLRLRRHYTFEYSERGDERRQGEIVLLGRHVETLRGDWLDGQPSAASAKAQTARPANMDTNALEKPDNVVKLSDHRGRRDTPR